MMKEEMNYVAAARAMKKEISAKKAELARITWAEAKRRLMRRIPQKMSGTGSIYDVASDMYSREIIFAPGCKYAVILSSYYGGKGYSTHKSPAAVIAASRKVRDYSHIIVDVEGNRLEPDWEGNLVELPYYGQVFE